MTYFADLHVHSRFSVATSKDCTLVELARWASFKGLRVLATGDFTHPQWSSEIRETLEDAGGGLFRLKREHVPQVEAVPGGFGPADVRFVLNVEISSIYKKRGAVRKVHNLVFMPDLESMGRFNKRLDRIGNIKSDGRPILGLDSRDLLEIALEASSESFLVPAHVWTPWFSLLGSRSGFDSVEECFEDLAPHIFALETGLSSDPEMNYRVSSLDRYTLISNSDTHSPANLGREANIFDGEPGYFAIRDALKRGGQGLRTPGDASGPRFLGTIEFFPEEGKYHLDGHRKCSMRLDPEETQRLGGICPICGHAVTVGVMNRVLELADRPAGIIPERAAPFRRVIPLVEITAQALGVGKQSKKAKEIHMDLIRRIGPELTILHETSEDELARHAPRIVVEGISRVRRGEVHIQGGYDGEYGTVELFAAGERDLFLGQKSLVAADMIAPMKTRNRAARPKRSKACRAFEASRTDAPELNEEQGRAVTVTDRPVVVKAGPGTGKTRTLVHRAVKLIQSGLAERREITAVTFTKKAAEEMRQRLAAMLPLVESDGIRIGTFHALAARIIEMFRREGTFNGRATVLEGDDVAKAFRQAVKDAGLEVPASRVTSLANQVSLLKQNLIGPDELSTDDVVRQVYSAYESHLEKADAMDLDDLLVTSVELLRDSPAPPRRIRQTMTRLLVDEFQDVNRAQYEMVRLLAGPGGEGLFAIGDPDQAIYGFRGADRRFFACLLEDYPAALEVHLTRNYRSQRPILKAAHDLISKGGTAEPLSSTRLGDSKVKLVRLPNPTAEGIFITRTIDSMLGGSTFFSMDSGRANGAEKRELGLKDFAVLYRFNAVGDALEEAFRTSGIPYQRARRERPEDEADALDPRVQAVTLMTMHAAKGLEFPVVFVAACEDGIVPYSPNAETSTMTSDPDEESRLLYVAFTRAEDELFVTSCSSGRVLFGRRLDGKPSPFLGRIDRSVCEELNPLSAAPRTRKCLVQGELFRR